MVRMAFGLLLLAASACHAGTLLATLDKSHSLLGEPVQLTLTAHDIDLSALDLAPLRQDFEILNQAASRSTVRGRSVSLLEVTLYPLRAGTLAVPPLRFSTWSSRPVTLDVRGGDANIHAWVMPAQPMEREAAVLHLTIEDDGSLAWTAPNKIEAMHALITPEGERTREFEQDGARRVMHEYRWRVLPLKPDSLTLALPMLDAYKFGQHLRFPAPAVSLRARAAPAYLPLYLPIGRPTVQNTRPATLIKGQPAAWQLDLDAPGLSAEGAARLLTVPDDMNVKFYPPRFTPVTEEGRTRLRGTLHFVPQRAGELALPALTLPYYDPASQRLLSVRIDAPSGVVRDPLREKIQRAAFALVGLLAMVWVGRHALRWSRRLRRKHAWLRQIREAMDARALYRALTTHAPVTIRTLHDWSRHHGAASEWVEHLDRARFGEGGANDWDTLKAAWLAHCARLPARTFT